MDCKNVQIMHSGYFEKKSKWIGSWRKRFIVLTSNFKLSTYKDNTQQTLTNTIDLIKYYNLVKLNNNLSKDHQYFCFELVASNKDKYEFRTNNGTDFNIWYEQIRQLLMSYHPNHNEKHKYKETNASFLIISYFHYNKPFKLIPNRIITLICNYYIGNMTQLWMLHGQHDNVGNNSYKHNHNKIYDVMDNYVDNKMEETQLYQLRLLSNVSHSKYDIKLKQYTTNTTKNDKTKECLKWNKIECGTVSQNISLPNTMKRYQNSIYNDYNMIPFSHKEMHGLMFINTLKLNDAFFMELPTNDIIKYSSIKIYNKYSFQLYLMNQDQIVSYNLDKLGKFHKVCEFKKYLALQISVCWLNEYQNKLFITNLVEKDNDIIHIDRDNYTSNFYLFMLDLDGKQDEKHSNYIKLSNMNYKRISPGCCYLQQLNKFVVGGNENHSSDSGWSSVVEFYDVFKNEWKICKYRCKNLYGNGYCHICADKRNPNVIYIFDASNAEWLDQRTNDRWNIVERHRWNHNKEQLFKSAFFC